ncbi:MULTISPECIES: glycosyltransferase family 4 protein [Microcystis]|uniref:Glycosyltransferase n=2 Tax=Microcystis TaxID=1125 RepID=A0A841UHP5_MICAE|nr:MULTISPECIES: glycosyltransferase family 4 protein [Microcystis]AKV65790.1 Glycosyltransferase [Microcystis panniformis FACHB-1757]MBC1190282.1 glycosyltransferase [Microcystis aeruginosa BLCC-F108]MCA2591916.1 glycosyltransferase [Microcystis sp. M31BS1]MDB9407859.1 glycosyltransferase family 4 protein [Microcystis aeruginosa CS-558/01A06]
MNILMISSTFPYPPSKGGTQGRTFNLLKHLSKNHDITLIVQRTADVGDEEVEKLGNFVSKLVVFPRPRDATTGIIAKLQRLAQFLQTGTPPNVLFGYSQEMQNWIDRAVKSQKFSVITSEHSVNEIYIRSEWQRQIRTVIDVHSSLYQTCKSQLEIGVSSQKLRDRLYLPLLRRYEQKTVQKFSKIVVTTDEDQKQMEEFAPNGEIYLIPNAVDLDLFPYRSQDAAGHNLVFIGGLDYWVNIDAACFLAREILPRIQLTYPDTTLTLVGANPSLEVQELTKLKGVIVTGRVPSMTTYLHQATVAVIPLRTGFGMKFKTLESMAAGVPVVASDRGLEGLTVAGNNVPIVALRANSIEEYCTAISSLFESAELREKLSRNARKLIEDKYTWQQAAGKYEQVLIADIC